MSLRIDRSAAWLVTLALASLLTQVAQAQSPSPPDPAAEPDPSVARAREAFRTGSSLARQGQWVEALAAFERSASLRSHPVTTYNIAYCERALGHSTRARKLFKNAMQESSPRQLLPDALSSEARGYVAEIERRLAHVMVTLHGSGAMAVDGRPLDAEPVQGGSPLMVAGTREPGKPEALSTASFRLLIDPGTHVFVLQAPGEPEIVVSRTLAPGSVTSLSLGRAPQRGANAVTRDLAADERAQSSVIAQTTWATIAFGVGAVGLVSGALLGSSALRERSRLQDACTRPDACPQSMQATIDRMNAYALGSTIGFVAGVCGVGVGTALLISGRESHRRSETPKRQVSPWVGIGSAGVSGTF